MHELAVTEGVIKVAVEAAGGRRVRAIDLVLGALSTIVDDSVQFYFDALSRATLAEGAVLRFRRVPATALCLDCGATTEVAPPLPDGCPGCGSSRLRVSGGTEFLVESIEVDDEPG
ncbi:MAG: hydrogenase maturation nickel metallochaperone HypA [Chloroflexales bacterium]|nr:hydrogenase maturation nickel metallochaperone HypA [Chloroflexales bacterium]